VLVITSAGCNALDYALAGAQVVAVDVNPLQNHLLELKRAGLRALDHGAFFALFGEGGCREVRDVYAALRAHLGEAARAHWDRAIVAFDPSRARGRSFYYAGTSGLFALAVRAYLERFGLRDAVERMLAATSVAEQREVYERRVRPRLLSDRAARLLGCDPVLAMVGVPPAQRRLVAESPGGFAGFLRACLDRVMSLLPLRENYFWSVYLTGRYEPGHCPTYLTREGFARLQAGLVDNVESVTDSVAGYLAADWGQFEAFVLLDHLDWLAQDPVALGEEWRRIFAAARPGARVIFRSGAADASFLPTRVQERLVFDRERAAALHRQDRVGTYGSFHLARVA
jgi:S-adenosylmethionine-diacylglycerol 3-amino-3-carboxypropyl transferase